MVNSLLERGVIQSPQIGKAFSSVPRHTFLDGVIPPEQAYYDQAVMLKFPGSSVSQPQVIASMLELLLINPGMKVLEIGTASGYNAALIAELTEDSELVFSIEKEKDLVFKARDNLMKAGYSGVKILAGDGSLGWPKDEGIHFDRIIITAQTPVIPPKLIEQLKNEGKLVTPLVFNERVTLLVRVEKGKRIFGRAFPFPVVFVPLKGKGVKIEGKDWRSLLDNLWRGIQPFCRNFPLDSPALWGVFLFLLREVFNGRGKERPEGLWYKWQAEGRPGVDDWFLEFNKEGSIEGVFKREE